jgi:predicted transcriptional regulator
MSMNRQPFASTASSSLPLAERLPDGIPVVEIFRRMASLPHVLFLDSALRGGRLQSVRELARTTDRAECGLLQSVRELARTTDRAECGLLQSVRELAGTTDRAAL